MVKVKVGSICLICRDDSMHSGRTITIVAIMGEVAEVVDIKSNYSGIIPLDWLVPLSKKEQKAARLLYG